LGLACLIDKEKENAKDPSPSRGVDRGVTTTDSSCPSTSESNDWQFARRARSWSKKRTSEPGSTLAKDSSISVDYPFPVRMKDASTLRMLGLFRDSFKRAATAVASLDGEVGRITRVGRLSPIPRQVRSREKCGVQLLFGYRTRLRSSAGLRR